MNERQILLQAHDAIQRKDKKAAQRLLYQAIKQYPKSETAWLWLSALVDDPEKERQCLLKVLEINPLNELAQKHLQKFAQTPALESLPEQPRQARSAGQTKGIKKNTKIMLAGVVVAFLLVCFACVGYSVLFDSPGTQSKSKPTWTPVVNPTVESRSMSRQEAIRRVEDLLSNYNIIGVQEMIAETGDHVLAISIRGSRGDAESLLSYVTVLSSAYVIIASPPFDAIFVTIYSPGDEMIIGSLVKRQDIENWLKGNISEEEFFSAWLIVES